MIGTISLRRAASIAPSSESLSHGCATAQVTASSDSQRLSSRANTSLRRTMNSGRSRSAYVALRVGASTTTRPLRTRLPSASTRQSNTTSPASTRFSSAVTVATTWSPTRIRPANWKSCDTIRVPGPGNRRSSSPETIALAATASTFSSSGSKSCPVSTWNGTTSPDTSNSASTSVWLSARSTLAVAPTSISLKVTLP